MDADQLLDNYNELQKIELRKNLNTYTVKELKKEIIKMKADKFAVTKMKRRQIIELIVQYHYLFPHLLKNQGSKRTAKGKQPTTHQLANYKNIPQLTYNSGQNIQQTKPTTQKLLQATQGIPLDIQKQPFPQLFN